MDKLRLGIPKGSLKKASIDLFRRADRRLYLAKEAGRNRVVSTDPEDPSASARGLRLS